MGMKATRVIVSLDLENQEDALKAVDQLKGQIRTFKIGKQLFTRYGPDLVREVMKREVSVFLDLKFHDIPNTVAAACREAVRLGVALFNVHACGGKEMLEAAAQATQEASKNLAPNRPLLLGVTVLTSQSENTLRQDLGCERSLEDQVVHLAKLSESAGLDGVVCSPREIKWIRKHCRPEFVTVTPGIRPHWAKKNDQERIMTPAEAKREGADYLVIGRPILSADDPCVAASRILDELK